MCLPFSTLSAKNVTADPEFGSPEILYHIREFNINKINLRIAEYVLYYYIGIKTGKIMVGTIVEYR